MKLITREEREAHATYLSIEGTKGFIYGGILSIGLFNFLKIRHPAKFKSFNTTIKTCILLLPAVSSCGFWADRGSVVFDRRMHSYGGGEKVMEEYRKWKKMSTIEKTATIVSQNKYKVLIGSWLVSLYGIWTYVETNKAMNAARKVSTMRNLGLASTSILAVGMGSLIMNGRRAGGSGTPDSKQDR